MYQRVMALLLTLMCTASSALAEAPAVDAERTVIVSGAIEQGNILGLLKPMSEMAAASSGPINIIFDSPGGEVLSGSLFINELRGYKARGYTVRCYVAGMAASMAFQILSHCSERYTLDRSFLLWHRVRVSFGGMGGAALTAPEAAAISRDLAAVDAVILRELNASLGIPQKDVLYHFNHETLHMGEQLGRLAPTFITSGAHIEGLLEAFHNPKVPRMIKPKNLLEELFGKNSGGIQYIWQGAAH